MAMCGYAELGVPHIMFHCQPYTQQTIHLLTEALRIYRGMERN